MNDNPFVGDWTYRSFLRNPDLSVEFNALRFGAGNLKIIASPFGTVQGTLGDTGWSLDLTGHCSFGNPNQIRFQGKGVISGEEWIYDYLGYLTPSWPNGIEEVPSIAGTIVRTISHSNGQAKAGFVASWIAVRQ